MERQRRVSLASYVIKYAIVVFIGILFVCTLKSLNSSSDIKSVRNTEVVSPVDYKNGVFYFEINTNVLPSPFGNSLSSFIIKHPELELVSIAPDGTYYNGRTYMGYFVVFRNKGGTKK